MKMQNIIRMNVIGLGVAAAMLLATTPAHAQEITNTEFSDGPYVTAYAQPTTNNAQTAQTTTQAPATSVATTPVISNTQFASMAGSADWAMAFGLSGVVVLLTIFAVGQYRRINRNLRPRRPLTRPVAFS